MLVRGTSVVRQPTAHGYSKRVFACAGLVPHITQLAVAELPCGAVVEDHVHPTMWEVFYSLEGEATYIIEGNAYPVCPGDLVIVPPAVRHAILVGSHTHRAFYFGLESAAER